MAIYSELSNLIDSYTGLSAASFFTILALMIGAFFLVSSFFVHPDDSAATGSSPPATDTAERSPEAEEEKPPEAVAPPAVFAKPVQMGEMSLEELKEYNGSDRNKPLLISIKGDVYNVSRGWLFYGPKGQYSFFAGREISRALALMSFDPNDFNDNLEDLGADELEVLSDWQEKFKERYVKVGTIRTSEKIEPVRDESHDDVARDDGTD